MVKILLQIVETMKKVLYEVLSYLKNVHLVKIISVTLWFCKFWYFFHHQIQALATLIGFEAQETYAVAKGHTNKHKKLKVKKVSDLNFLQLF